MAAEMCNLQHGDSWITPIYRFLAHGTLRNDKVQAKQIRYKATRYLIINDQLYKRCFNLPYLRCLTHVEAKTILREIHEGISGNHAGSRYLSHKAFRQGYYWPTLHQDAIRISRSCDKCQRYTTIPHSPPEPLTHATNQVKNGGQPQFSKASHTLDQYSVKQNQFMVPTGASSIDGNHNSQKLHTLLIKTV
ncbi:hypothetical protein EV1_013474 [Malus domestica]